MAYTISSQEPNKFKIKYGMEVKRNYYERLTMRYYPGQIDDLTKVLIALSI